MNGKSQKLFNIVICTLLVLCIFKMSAMNEEISKLRSTMNNNYSSLNHSISLISGNVRHEMEQANNLLGDSNWVADSLNMEDKTVVLSCYVVPKSYNPQQTFASVICNGQEVPMTLVDGKYTANITIPLFENTKVSHVQFSENGTIRTQQLNWSINPRYDMIPTAYMYYSGGTRQNYKGDTITRTYTGYAEVDFNYRSISRTIRDAEIIILINGGEVVRSKPVLEELHRTEDYASYRTKIEQSFEVKQGDNVKMYMTFADDNGWIYRGVIEDITIGDKNEPVREQHYQAEADIYDTNGTLLFRAEKY